MVVVVDTVSATPLRPRHPEKVNRPDALSPPKPDWIRVRAPNTPRLCRHPQDRQGKRPGHRLRGGGLPEHRRVLGQEARHLHDHGRHLHPRLRLLQRQDRHARRARCRRAGACRGGDLQARARPHRDHLGRPRRSRRRRRRAFRADHPRDPRALPGHHDRDPDAGLPAQGRRARSWWSAAKPDVFNHNLETVPSRYLTVRPGARYFHSIRLLQRVKEIDPAIFTKSGIMVGLGEERHEVLQVMDDLRSADVDFLTIGQYLQPTRKHHAVMRYVTAGRVRGLREGRLHQGLPDGVGEPADPLVASCRRRFREAAGGARSRLPR